MTKLNACYITFNEERWLELSMLSIIDHVDKFIFIDSGSTDKTKEVAMEICNKYNKSSVWITYKRKNIHSDDGDQRNEYIDYLKKNCIGEWALVIDADECISGDLKNVKHNLDNPIVESFNLSTRHLINDFGHEDSSIKEHFTLRRLFKVTDKIFHARTEHGVLQGVSSNGNLDRKHLTLWHFAHARHAFYWLDKHITMKNKSEIHDKDQQEVWYYSLLMGRYPTTEVDPTKLPDIIKSKFFVAGDINKWKYPFIKHLKRKFTSSDMAFETIKEYIEDNRLSINNLLDVGCGEGLFRKQWENLGCNYIGMDTARHTNVQCRGSMDNIPFWDNIFEGIFCCHVFEHTLDPIKTLDEFKRVLSPSGLLFLITPYSCLREMVGMDKQHMFVLNQDQINNLLVKNGFSIMHNSIHKESEEEEVTWSNLTIARLNL